MLKVLQNILFDSPDETSRELYVRGAECHKCNDGIWALRDDKANFVCSFDTYFNSFSFQKWIHYTKVNNILLELEAKGVFSLAVYGVDDKNNEVKIEEQKYSIDSRSTVRVKINCKDEFVLVFFRIVGSECTIYAGRWSTECQKNSLRNIVLSVGICTYRREKFIKKNVDNLVKFLDNDQEMNSKIFIHIADNGQSLSEEICQNRKNIFLHPNVNSGGSGGFSRCMLETRAQTPAATHILLMDDDVLLEPESIYRTITFLELLKEEYSLHVISGAMLSLDAKNLQTVREECFYPFPPYRKKCRPSADLLNRNELIFNDKLKDIDNLYSAWFYSVIPCMFIENGFSYPLFFQLDDIEYSIRNKLKPIHLNGISVWHEPFWKKINSSREYYIVRNTLIVASFCPNKLSYNLLYIAKRFFYNIFTFNYTAANYITAGIEAFLQGPENILKDGKWQTHPNLNESCSVVSNKKIKAEYVDSAATTSKIKILISAITMNGHLIPDMFLGKCSGICENKLEHLKYKLLKRSIVLADGTTACKVFAISRKNATRSIFCLLKQIIRYIFQYKETSRKWKASRDIYTTESWWKKNLFR